MIEEPNERLRILEMIEHGEISAEEGWQRLQDLNSADQDVEEDVLEQDIFPGAAALPPADMPESGAMQPPPPDFSRWRSLWAIPMWVGIGFTILFAYLMSTAAAAGSVFWMLCASLPFALGVLLIVIGWGSRTAHWLHLRVQQPPGTTPQRISISFPLPLQFAGWILRIFRGRIKGMEDIDVEGMLAAVGSNTSPENPLYVEVDEGDGEKVQIYIG
jgi:hypothetical protein